MEAKVAGCLPYLEKSGLVAVPVSEESRAFVTRLIAALSDRLKLFSDVLDVAYFFREDVGYDEKEFAKRVQKEGVPQLLAGFRERIAALPNWTSENLETTLKAYCEEQKQSAGTLIHALRISTTGVPIGPGVYDCVLLVGREQVLKRIDQAVQRATLPT